MEYMSKAVAFLLNLNGLIDFAIMAIVIVSTILIVDRPHISNNITIVTVVATVAISALMGSKQTIKAIGSEDFSVAGVGYIQEVGEFAYLKDF